MAGENRLSSRVVQDYRVVEGASRPMELGFHLASPTELNPERQRESRLKISTVIMLYNEEEGIDEFSTRLIRSLEALNHDYEVIFVVEGTDSTLQKVSDLAKWNPRIRSEE